MVAHNPWVIGPSPNGHNTLKTCGRLDLVEAPDAQLRPSGRASSEDLLSEAVLRLLFPATNVAPPSPYLRIPCATWAVDTVTSSTGTPTLAPMGQIRIGDAAALLGVSDDTVRRWVDQGRLSDLRDEAGTHVVDGVELAATLVDSGRELERLGRGTGRRSARNYLTGIVTRVVSDTVMSQVEIQCGPYRVVSLISTEAVQELGLEPGSIATAVVKATNVSIEAPA